MKRGSVALPEAPAASRTIGFVEWFRPGEFERVEAVLRDMRALGVENIRTGISWADWYASEGAGWYAWLLPRLAQDVRVLPCVLYTPPSIGLVPKYSSPPARPKAYADFIDVFITQFGSLFEWMELWNCPNNPMEWDSRLDPDWKTFCEMIGGAAYWIQRRGKKAVLPGLWPSDLNWLDLMKDRGVLSYISAIGVQGFPGATEVPWQGWNHEIAAVRERLAKLHVDAEVWITQTGFSTWRTTEREQVHAFLEAVNAPVERVYWRGITDSPLSAEMDPSHSDEREYHYGLKRADGTPKLLFDLWNEGGIKLVRETHTSQNRHRQTPSSSRKHVLITGGAGFIGTNLASRLLASGESVLIYDNLSRPGTERNAAMLAAANPGHNLRMEVADVRDQDSLRRAVRDAHSVFHFAAQVAVTTSIVDPRTDFEVNVGGTLNLLEAMRELSSPPPLLFTSTNKVYGALQDIALIVEGQRYQPQNPDLRLGIDEHRRLDFHSPYGCSKGSADQYVLDYARSFQIPAVVFRMSCIYGLHQNGTEDQGWVAHFLLQALRGEKLTVFGDGMQVRDLLFVEDLVDAFLLAESNISTLAGQVFNIGGGLGNTISLRELLDVIETLHGRRPKAEFTGWRTGDQRYYVSNTRRFKLATGWTPTVNLHEGIKRLYEWLQSDGAAARIGERGYAHALLAD